MGLGSTSWLQREGKLSSVFCTKVLHTFVGNKEILWRKSDEAPPSSTAFSKKGFHDQKALGFWTRAYAGVTI